MEGMGQLGFLARIGILRSAIREDLLYFAIPALLVLPPGLVIRAKEGHSPRGGRLI
jgi:hypothetical protein